MLARLVCVALWQVVPALTQRKRFSLRTQGRSQRSLRFKAFDRRAREVCAESAEESNSAILARFLLGRNSSAAWASATYALLTVGRLSISSRCRRIVST